MNTTFNSDNNFQCWPSLAAYAKRLTSKRFNGLFYYDYGPQNNTGKPVLILVHGLGDEADTWRHIIRPLGDAGFRVLAPDLPGFGRSSLNMRSSVACHRDAVLTLAAAESGNAEQGFVLIGSSMGASIAEAAALSDSRIKALVLMDGCIPMESAGSSHILLMAFPFIGKKWYRSFRNDPDRAWKSLFSYYADIQALSEEDRDFLRKRVMDRVCSPSQERGYFSSLRSMIFQSLRSSYYKRIGSWPGKIALVWGEKDQIMPINVTESFIKLRSADTTEMFTIPGAGHLPHQDKPAETAKTILGFLETL
ncbi:MAG: alpha/beta hydrolase [Treponema sp.]|nr:alpha/beta hydrolase [Treponema sp.]